MLLADRNNICVQAVCSTLSLWDVSCLYKAECKLGTGAVRVLFPAGAMHANIYIYS